MKFTKLLAALAGFSAFCPSTQAAADQVWGEVGGWRIGWSESSPACIARTEYEGGTEVMLQASGEEGSVLLNNRAWSFIRAGNSYQVTLKFDARRSWNGDMTGQAWDDGTFGFIIPGNSRFLAEVAHSNGIQVFVQVGRNQRFLTSLRLDGTRAALTAAMECTNQLAQRNGSQQNPLLVGTGEQRASSSLYVVDGLALGDSVHFGSATYNAYQCRPSDQFPGFTWCQRQQNEKRGKNEIFTSNSILHRADGTTSYINRVIRPAVLNEAQANREVDRLSTKFGEKGRVLYAPALPGVPRAMIASWGQIDLVPVDKDAMALLAAGESPRIGLLIDFLGDLQKSAKLGLPVYRLSGGPGYVWTASFDQSGVGHLRFLAADPSTLSQPEATATGPSGVERKEVATTGEGSQGDKPSSSGTGIIVSVAGHVLTNYHVIEGCSSIKTVKIGDIAKPAHVLRSDSTNDLAILKTDETIPSSQTAKFRVGLPVKPGEVAAVYGYPLVGALSLSGNIVSGNVSSLSGLADDVRFLQISAPVQPGNSGGPLLDASGLLIGVVSSQINEIAVAQRTGSIPQNVNFAIKGTVAMNFLEAHSIPFETSSSSTSLGLTDIADEAKAFTVLILCQ